MATIFDASKVKSVVIKNVYDDKKIPEREYALAGLSSGDNKLFNTGASALGNPHSNEDPAATGKTLVPGAVGPEFVKEHTAALRLFNSNEYVNIKPGEDVILKVNYNAEIAYYRDQAAKFGFLKVSFASNEAGTEIIEGSAVPQNVSTVDVSADNAEKTSEPAATE